MSNKTERDEYTQEVRARMHARRLADLDDCLKALEVAEKLFHEPSHNDGCCVARNILELERQAAELGHSENEADLRAGSALFSLIRQVREQFTQSVLAASTEANSVPLHTALDKASSQLQNVDPDSY
jgi:hypothetical protein